MDDFNILEHLASQAPSTLILGYVLYRLFKMYLKEKADRISTSKEYTAYLAEFWLVISSRAASHICCWADRCKKMSRYRFRKWIALL
jgi:hypothetical protein